MVKSNKNNPKVVFLTGKKVLLRPLQEGDINERYLSWLNDQEVTKYMTTGVFPATLKELQDFCKKIKNSKNDLIFAIANKRNNLHIGNIKLGGINWIHRFADLGIMIGDKKYWGKGYGVESCNLLLEYAFKRLNLNKVILGVYAMHASAIKTYQRIGFKIEGRLKKLFFIDGRWTDEFIMGILRENFKDK